MLEITVIREIKDVYRMGMKKKTASPSFKTRRSRWIIRKMCLWGINSESVNGTKVAQNGIKMQGSGVQNSGSKISKSAFCQKTTAQTYLYNKHQSFLNYVGSRPSSSQAQGTQDEASYCIC